MKPVKLVMSAFGSYSDVAEVDFTQTNRGIFLITGDTGAGKTTIFDAIIYALYDRTSAGAREPADMRSQYADMDTPTYVSYTFCYENTGETYTVRRNPRYTRAGKRRDKDGKLRETTEQPAVELTLPDGTVFAGKLRETNEKLVEIVGLDAEQFMQIAMLAQGEFMKLLQAPSNKRKEIFGKIFNTGIYCKLQETLRSEAKKRYIALEDNRKFCERELAAIKADDTEAVLAFTDYNHAELLAGIARRLQDKDSQEAQNQDALKKLQTKLEQFKIELAAAEQFNRLCDDMEQAKRQQEALEQRNIQIAALTEGLANARKAEKVTVPARQCGQQRTVIMESARRAAACERELTVLSEQLAVLSEQQRKAEREREETEPQLQGELARLREELPLYEQADGLDREITRASKELQKMETGNRKRRCEAEQLQQQLLVFHQTVQERLGAYQQASDAFVAEQAGILARELRENMPCPVCGATVHPKKAVLSDGEISQEQVKRAKADWQEAEAEETQCMERLRVIQTELAAADNAFAEKNAAYEALKARRDALRERLCYRDSVEAETRQERIGEELSALTGRVRQAEQDRQLAGEKVTQISGKLAAEREQQRRLSESLKALETELSVALETQGFADMAAYEAAVMDADDMEQTERQIREHREALVRTAERVEQLERQLQGRQRVELGQIRERIAETEEAYAALERETKALYAANRRNREAYDALCGLYDKRMLLKQEYELYSTLDKTANGNLSGVAKLDLQTYVQRRYFEAIIHEANKRLIKMSGNQFLLQCRSLDRLGGQGAVGLDLDVYSIVNDRTRDVKTLSGGESFMAALAMALGMSDVIQSTAGRVRLDTMFVDEGFGSLDDESRGEAVKILQELAGDRKLVGIISHVSELREQIDRKLIVKKDENGSSVEWSK